MMSAQLKAMRKKGNRKHLDFLLEDLRVEYHDTLAVAEQERLAELAGREQPLTSGIKKEAAKEPDMEEMMHAPQTQTDHTPPYVYGGVVARDMSRMVNERRTPSGNFFQITNPALHVPRLPGTNQVVSAPGTPFRESQHNVPAPSEVQESIQPPTSGFARDPMPWLTPAQKNDRQGGMKAAKLVNSKRTPNGGFFNSH
mmetsp:Transcript_50559/g.96564  ORF Transcript_50559/g.96564 Transcript_50559/m.96564 type:complete len:198 (+) Transcript_50559:286-879(+)|eukprot:CAMPEP_0114253578 /NCGR_PEP_ID=MMETSP0058-20121206/16470_1 /TAXON_ID=36894 /ORGANISM="Pyramimonas parkeae, CCMP726" /LENGTH=197 /DNA_ID=CAMNT_0001367639 /DNA_START=286 /DNA_END=879 /DNA_ORIENTATION=+